MPEINVQDEKGTIHSFPDGSTPEMIAEAMGVRPPDLGPDPLSKQTQDTANAASASTKPAPLPNVPMRNAYLTDAQTIASGGPPQTFNPRGNNSGQTLNAPVPYLGSTSVPRFIGGLAGNIAASKAGSMVSDNPWVRDLSGLAGAVLGSGTGAALEDIGKNIGPLEIPQKIDLPLGMKLPWKRTLPSQGTGAPLPDAGDFYQNKAADLMRRGREQAALDRTAARNAPKPETPVDPVALAVKSRTAAWLPTKIKPNQDAIVPWQRGAITESGAPEMSGQDLISRTRRLTIPGEEPNALDLKRAGDLTQAPLGRLQMLAKWGDKLAQNEVNRRLKNQ